MHNALSRRALLASPLALAAPVAPASAATTAASDELQWLIDTYEEIRAEYSQVQKRVDDLWDGPTRPEMAQVSLREAAANLTTYGMPFLHRTFSSVADINEFFDMYVRYQSPWWGAGSPQLRAVEEDRRSARRIYEERHTLHSAWGKDSGFNALDERADQLHGKIYEIEKWMRAYTCRSLGDVIAIAAFADRWFPDDEPDIDARSDLLRAISAFAVSTIGGAVAGSQT